MKLSKVGGLAAAAIFVAAACSSGSGAPASGGGGGGGGTAVKIGIELPMTGGEAPNGEPTAKGVQLALKKIPVPGFTITINQQDDAVNGKHQPNQGAKNMQTLANDQQVIAVVGPYNTNVAQAEIPVSNASGLMQCSPANTGVGLTKGDAAKALRKTNPDKITYVRVATTDDNQGAGTADIAFTDVKAKKAYVLDDTQGRLRPFVRSIDGVWSITPKGTGTLVGWAWTLHPKASPARLTMNVIGRMWKGYADRALVELETILMRG